MDPEVIGLHGSFVRSFRLGSGEAQSLSCTLRQLSLYFTAQEANLPTLCFAPGTKGGHGKVLPPYGHFLLLQLYKPCTQAPQFTSTGVLIMIAVFKKCPVAGT